MTREEVIKYLEQHGYIDGEVEDMCIEALDWTEEGEQI